MSAEDMARIVRRSFSLTEKDLEIIRVVVEKCGFVSDSEALRAIIRFFEQHAPCMSQR
jgi:Arc/MetJ-type ribon-helix-helix transcriptional regulator